MVIVGRHCRSLRSLLQRHFSYSTTTTAKASISSSISPDSLSSLTNLLVSSLGFSEEQALSTFDKLTQLRQSRRAKEVSGFNFSSNANLVISFLQNKGLDKPQIRNIVHSVPFILTCRVERNLEPKMKAFQEMGISVSEIAHVISTQPAILGSGLHSTIHPALATLREILGSNENAFKLLKEFRFDKWSLILKHLVYNVSLLRDKGIPNDTIAKHMLNRCKTFVRRHKGFNETVTQVEEKWGISPSSTLFMRAVNVISSQGERAIESKCRLYESFGWDRSNVMDLFRRNPDCLGASEETIKAKLSFFMNELGYDAKYIVAHPAMLNYSLEKRVFPRHQVLQILKDKGLISGNLALYSAVSIPELQFLRRFIQPYQDNVPNLLQIYVGNQIEA